MTAVDTKAADLKWLGRAEHWGEWLRFSETELAEPERVWMMRHDSGRVRFYAIGRGQVGPECPSIVAATYWAFWNRYIDPECSISHNLACRAEVLAGGAPSRGAPAESTPPAAGEASRGDNPAATPTKPSPNAARPNVDGTEGDGRG